MAAGHAVRRAWAADGGDARRAGGARAQVAERRPWGHAGGILVGGPALGAPAANGDRYFGADDPRGELGEAAGY